MRLFTAFEIPQEAKDRIAELQDSINTNAYIKWVKKENLHITLKFYGEVRESGPVEDILHDISQDFKPFEVSLSEPGAFPSESKVRVLWIGTEMGTGEISSIFRVIDEKSESIGFEREKREFTPHITIGRVKSGKFNFPDINFSYPPFKVKWITLFESNLTPSGPIYNVVGRFPGGVN